MSTHRKSMPLILALFTLTIAAFCLSIERTSAQAVPGYCAAPYKINWPAANPVWSLCWTPPNSSSGVDGSGLEITHAFYKGRRVIWQANVPVLNVKYDPGGCGGSNLSYRDWQNQLQDFEANNVISPGYAEPTAPPKTVCDHPGSDAGSFSGVAVEKKADKLILTTQMQAGWYRYIMKWTFYLDGTIEPRFGFTAVDYPCTTKFHTHHVYWRFDLDIEGAANDRIDQRAVFFGWLKKPTEFSTGSPLATRWRIMDNSTGRGYAVTRGTNDGPADAWAVANFWGLRYRFSERDDGGATGGPTGDAEHISNYLNGESISGNDVVFWYHARNRHAGGINCDFVGPTLKPIGSW